MCEDSEFEGNGILNMQWSIAKMYDQMQTFNTKCDGRTLKIHTETKFEFPSVQTMDNAIGEYMHIMQDHCIWGHKYSF